MRTNQAFGPSLHLQEFTGFTCVLKVGSYDSNGFFHTSITWRVKHIIPRKLSAAGRVPAGSVGLTPIFGPKDATHSLMRIVVSFVVFASMASAQFKSTVPLVVAPTTVTDSKGRCVDGLTAEDLILYDNNVPQAIQMDWMPLPISLVVAVPDQRQFGTRDR